MFNFGAAPSVGVANPAPAMNIPQAPTTSSTSFSTHPFQYIQECLDPNSPNYRFRVSCAGIGAAPARPAHVSQALWTQTLNDNPDPSKYPHKDSLTVRMAPVLANGFNDLTTRRAWQKEHEVAQRGKLDELEQRLALLLTRQDLDVSTQLQVIQKQQLKLTLRVVQLMRRVEVLRRVGGRMTPAEQALLGRIQSITMRLNHAPISGILSMQSQLNALMEGGRLDPLASARQCVIADEQSMDTLYTLLEQQQRGVKAVIETINKDSRDLDLMRHGFTLQ
ncbi:hypothetical protein PSACC_01185 [Paramicrosporidium saccamoebae]|uniref:Nucleoporin Nup54 alpha-helical domain-containing protein n=1 Tax=Paramicrosporidium saccamoebae TaxID=1246581 RepID=A0A2H9TMQ3_9FUNG|nr:hypothetical protein PSACC_01185 [Paramicrosporidium saccamoebae]